MSLSTLLEAAQYLDYLDSNQKGSRQAQQQQPQLQPQPQHQQRTQSPLQFQHTQLVAVNQPAATKKSTTRRQRSSRKDAANTMLAMSLPTSTMNHGVPIPLGSSSNHHNYHQPASLSSSFTTESPLSSFASTALLCSKASGVTSASSSAASSLSSSDSSSSCGEILMGDNDFNQTPSVWTNCAKDGSQISPSLSHQRQQQQQQIAGGASQHQKYKFGNDNDQSFAHYIASTSTGPQLVTMSTASSSGASISASAPFDSRLRAGHVIHAATNSAGATGASFDPRQFSIASPNGMHRGDGRQPSFGIATSLGSDSYLSSSPGTCAPLIMARVQPMILNSISPSAHQSIMAFQQQSVTASSPTSSSSSYSRHRELHKTLEKNRRAHLRHCFELLKTELPASDCVDKKTSHINIIKSAIRYVLALRQQESEMDNELQRLTRIKNELTDRLSQVRNEQQKQAASSTMQQSAFEQVPQQSLAAAPESIKVEPGSNSASANENQAAQNLPPQLQQPAAEQQLSFLLSQSKID